MSQKVIEVTLTVLSDVDVLIFGLDEEHSEAYVVNLNSSNSQNELKNVFSRLLQMLLCEDIALKYIIAPGYNKGLYKDVCKEYIDDLNKELLQVKGNVDKETN